MKRPQLVRAMLAAFAAWLEREMGPAGKVTLHTLTARGAAVISTLPSDGHAPPLSALETLNAASVEAGLDWLLTALRVNYPDDWAPVATEALRVLLRRNVAEIVAMAQPPVPAKEEEVQS